MPALNCKEFNFTGHATEQMFARQISVDEVKKVVKDGQSVASYPNDKPHPSFLVLSYIDERPIHVVVAVDTCIIITAYEPSSDLWKDDFKNRK